MQRRIGSGERYVGLYLPEKAPGVAPFEDIGPDKGFEFIILSGEYILGNADWQSASEDAILTVFWYFL